MNAKKSKSADLNRFSSLFVLMALVLLLFGSWRMIETKQEKNFTSTDYATGIRIDDPEQVYSVKKIKPPQAVKQKIKKVIPVPPKPVEDNIKTDSLEYIGTDAPIDIPVDNPPETIDEGVEEEPVQFLLVEQAPIFPGCEKYRDNKDKLKNCMVKKISRFINKRFDHEILSDYDIEGNVKVFVQFIVDKDGKIKDIKTRSQYRQLSEEIQSVLKELPAMKPGKQRGIPVKVRYSMPVIFKATD